MNMSTFTAAIVLAATVASPAFAMAPRADINARVQSAIVNSGQVSVKIDAGTATLYGWVENAQDRQAITRAALDTSGILKVVDLTVKSR